MLAIITQNGTGLIEPASLKNASSSLPISSSLECSANAWSQDNSQLYLANSSCIKRYTTSELLLEDFYSGSDTVTCLEICGGSSILFFAAGNKVWSLDCTHSPGRVLSSLEYHKNVIAKISISNDGTLLASVSASAVSVHNLTLSSHSQLKGLPDKKPITCCLFHQHSRTKLLLAIGREIFVYNATRTSSPLKIIRIAGGGDIVGVAASPFSKTLVAAVTSNGDVALVDLDKDNGVLKTVNVKATLTCCAFTLEGAAMYLGTKSGRLLILDLRSLEKEPRSFTVGDGTVPIKAINVQGKPKSQLDDIASVKAKSSSTAVKKSSPPQRSASSTRAASISSVVVGGGVRSPTRAIVASKIRGGGGVTPKKKLFSVGRTPLSETKNLGIDAQLAASRSPTLSRRVKPLKFLRGREREENRVISAQPPSPTTSRTTEPADGHTKPISSHKMGRDTESLGFGPAPESISGHLATMRVRIGPPSDAIFREECDQPKRTTRRIVSDSANNAPVRQKLGSTSTGSGPKTVSSSEVANEVVVHTQHRERQSTTLDDDDDHFRSTSPELPQEPVTPILRKDVTRAPSASTTCTNNGVLGLGSPEVAKWARNSLKAKGKEKVVEVKKTRFVQDPDTNESFEGRYESEDEDSHAFLVEEQDETGQELSLQVSPRRPNLPTWLQSPHRPSATNLNMNATAQDFLRNIVHDVMYDFQRESKAEMMGLHLDLVRMGRGWKRELREIMEERNVEIQELRAENRRLKEENERLRRGY